MQDAEDSTIETVKSGGGDRVRRITLIAAAIVVILFFYGLIVLQRRRKWQRGRASERHGRPDQLIGVQTANLTADDFLFGTFV
ncbi:hypothetical protein G5V57_21675 [Nordella sp. HKS 07]|uniref:hypothetical protein n=1 Tax=Nordella sp. HKS 07 TaxID=2712222 RepID=UPI0013E1D38C|nr:hypothetical protein [Nordella sp. HKS 07]QIG50099.1 hypothetical protein G5V57_21675 [Nordella sp. HKS 07]